MGSCAELGQSNNIVKMMMSSIDRFCPPSPSPSDIRRGRQAGAARRRNPEYDLSSRYATRNYSDFTPDDDDGFDEEEDDEDGLSTTKEKTKCSICLAGFRQFVTFLLSHVGLVTLVLCYCLLGAVIFENLEKNYEIAVKRNMSKVRSEVSNYLWEMTDKSLVVFPHDWILNASMRLQEFEMEILRLMRKEGWDGIDSEDTRQWTFAGALFYSIVVITTIGYGHITPKTAIGKIVTMFYAIFGIPMMLICLSHIGDFLATAFRILYWKVCCYICTRRPKYIVRPPLRARSFRAPARNTRFGNPQRPLSRSKSCRASALSYESAQSSISDSVGHSRMGQHRAKGFRRTWSHDDFHALSPPTRKDQFKRERSASPNTSFPSPKITPSTIGGESSLAAAALTNTTTLGPKQSVDDSTAAPTTTNQMNSSRNVDEQNTKFGSSLPRGGGGGGGGRQAAAQHLRLGTNTTDKLPIFINKYAVDEVTPLSSYKKGRNKFQRRQRNYGGHARPFEEIMMEEYAEYEDYYYDDYYDDYDDDDEEEAEVRKRPVPIWLCIILVLSYIVGGAFLFSNWEGWEILDSAYFCFVTLTTIGFGDYVPAQKVKRDVEMSIALCSIYLLFGISLLAMSFNLVQEQVITSIKSVATKLGIIKEEDNHE